MDDLPRNTVLGELRLADVLEYYDFPRLFTCKNTTGQAYVAVSTFDDDSEQHWVYLPISSLRLGVVLAGGMALRQAFRNPEGGFLAKVTVFLDARAPEVTFVLPEQIPDDDLPSQDYFANAESLLAGEDNTLTPRQVAVATRRETFDYRIFPGQPDLHEVPARKLGGILTSTQELVDALGQASLGQPTVRGPIPAEILQQTKVNVSHVFRGSFGVQFRAVQFSDLLEQSTLSSALRELANLLQAEDSEDLLSNKLHALKGRVASKYRRLLKELADIDSGLLLDWGSVNESGGGQFQLSAAQLKRAYAIVDRVDIEMAPEVSVGGKLIGFNSRTQRYELLSSEDGRAYAGKVSDEAKIDVPNPAIGEFYEANLRMLVETQSTSGDELIRWVLVRLGPLPSARAT